MNLTNNQKVALENMAAYAESGHGAMHGVNGSVASALVRRGLAVRSMVPGKYDGGMVPAYAITGEGKALLKTCAA